MIQSAVPYREPNNPINARQGPRGHSGKGSLILLEYLEVVCAYLGVAGDTDVTKRLPLGVAVFKSASLRWRWGQGEDNRGTKKKTKTFGFTNNDTTKV